MDKLYCKECGTELSGREEEYCSKSCNNKFNHRKMLLLGNCHQCGRGVRRRKREVDLIGFICRNCSSKRVMESRDYSGSKSPVWKGGSKEWQAGKHGRDKDGLSWRVQRQLAWERDGFACRECGKKQDGWKPDCHHVKPYRLSFSHALENLICLCRSCHKKAEAQITELWGGHMLRPVLKVRERAVIERVAGVKVVKKVIFKEMEGCKVCGSKKRIMQDGLCGICSFKEKLLPEVVRLRKEGLSLEEIGRRVGKSHASVSLYLRGIVDFGNNVSQ